MFWWLDSISVSFYFALCWALKWNVCFSLRHQSYIWHEGTLLPPHLSYHGTNWQPIPQCHRKLRFSYFETKTSTASSRLTWNCMTLTSCVTAHTNRCVETNQRQLRNLLLVGYLVYILFISLKQPCLSFIWFCLNRYFKFNGLRN